MFTMLIDHLTYAFFENYEIGRLVGRIAIPKYAYLLILGRERPKNRRKYLNQLLIIALISQEPNLLLFENDRLNVVFTLWAIAIL